MQNVERGRRIELLALAWKAKVLPLYEPRVKYVHVYLQCYHQDWIINTLVHESRTHFLHSCV